MSGAASAYEMTVGLEVHAELKTESKIFCSCSTAFGAPPNTQCCPVCMGLPGALPTLNRSVVALAIRAGLATGCTIAHRTHMDRKNYFYPDMPKAYQISQYDQPLCRDGFLEIGTETGKRRIGIARIHIEEDAGKLLHDADGEARLDYNRAGVGLIEIVSEPQIHSGEEARAYLQKLRSILLYTEVSDCRMNEGSLRCDVNLSVRRRGEEGFGTRVEIKNLNSFAFIVKAIDEEFSRQVALLEAGETVLRETRRFNESTGKTERMRGKESAEDYRFFPEPDLPPMTVDEAWIDAIRQELPKLPDERRAAYEERYGISSSDGEALTADRAMADFFEEAAACAMHPKRVASLMLSEIARLSVGETFACPISPAHVAELADLWGEDTVNSSTAKTLITELFREDQSPAVLVRERNLGQINDRDTLATVVAQVIAENPRAVADYRSGKKAAAKVIVGRVMAQTGGRANPVTVNALTEEALK